MKGKFYHYACAVIIASATMYILFYAAKFIKEYFK